MRRTLGHRLAGASLALTAMSAGIVVATGSAAMAAPCKAYRGSSPTLSAYSKCAANTYRWWHQVWIKCQEGPPSNPKVYVYSGNVAGGTSQSRVYCPQQASKVLDYGVYQGQDD
jgi:hypothetical protein